MLKFGTSGLRGLVTEMTDKEVFINTRGFMAYLIQHGLITAGDEVFLAGDLRQSTAQILLAVAAAVKDSGHKSRYAGRCPTPALMAFGLHQHRASIMVTGSHIPGDRNGIKFNKPDGEILKADEPAILDAVHQWREQVGQDPYADWFDQGGKFRVPPQELPQPDAAAMAFYERRYLEFFPAGMLAGKKIVVDQHSAVGRDFLPKLLTALGAQVVTDGRTDYFVAIDTENVTAEAQARFRALAQKHRPFAIVSTDGDSDRPFILDDQGRFYRGDLVGAMVASYLQARFAALPISTNDAVLRFLEQKGIAYQLTKIGSPYVIAAMNGAAQEGEEQVVGWEVNGGFMTATACQREGRFLESLPTRDALLPILVVLYLAVQAGGLDKVFDHLPQRFTQAGLLDHFSVTVAKTIITTLSSPEQAAQEVCFEQAQQAFLNPPHAPRQAPFQPASALSPQAFWSTGPHEPAIIKATLEAHYFTPELGFDNIKAINWLDGVRLYFHNHDIVHIRPSGNAPQLRLYANCDHQERADAIVTQGLASGGILRQMERDIAEAKA